MRSTASPRGFSGASALAEVSLLPKRRRRRGRWVGSFPASPASPARCTFVWGPSSTTCGESRASFHGGLFTQGGYVGGALTIDATPIDWFTVAVGPLVDEYDGFSNPATALGGTLRLDFHPWAARTTTGRSAFTIGVVGDFAAASNWLNSPGVCASCVGGGYLTVGYAHY